MREDDMLRLSLDCARMAVRGEDYASLLAEGVYRILDADAGVGVTRFPAPPGDPVDIKLVVSGVPPIPAQHGAEALRRIDRHPTLSRPDWMREAPTGSVITCFSLRFGTPTCGSISTGMPMAGSAPRHRC